MLELDFLGPLAANQRKEAARTLRRARIEVPRVRSRQPPHCQWRPPHILLQDYAALKERHRKDSQQQGGVWVKWKPGSARHPGPFKGPEEDDCGVFVA